MLFLDRMPVRNPVTGTFELTIRCNLHCKMCLFRHDDSENAELMANELTAEQWVEMGRQVAEAGTLNLLITGGEPMLRPDFCEIWKGIYKQGFIISLYTNATLVTPEIMATLRKYPPHRIGITFYGASPETYEKVTGNAAAFELALKGAHELASLPSMVSFRMTVIRDNLPDVNAVDDLVKSEFGPDNMVTLSHRVHKPVRGGNADVASCRLSPEDNFLMLKRKNVREIKRIIGDSFDEDCLTIEENKARGTGPEHITLFGCNAGMESYAVAYDGKLLGCQLLGMFSTDAAKNRFKSAWEEFPYTVDLPELNPKCRSCKDRQFCENCYVSRFAETGDLAGVPEYSCKEARYIHELIDGGK